MRPRTHLLYLLLPFDHPTIFVCSFQTAKFLAGFNTDVCPLSPLFPLPLPSLTRLHFRLQQYNDSLLRDLGLDPYRQKGGFGGWGWLFVSPHAFVVVEDKDG